MSDAITIKAKLQSTSIWLKTHAKLHTVVALLVLLAGLAATFYYWHNLRMSVREDMQTAYERQIRTLGNLTGARIELYDNLLSGSAGLFTIHSGTTQEDWDKFHQPYEIRQKYPDIQGVGVNRYLKADEVPAYLERRRAQGDTGFNIFPAGERDVYVPVTFNARYVGNNGKSRGYDGYTDPVRRAAMDRAVETNKPAMSGVVNLVSEARGDRPSFILYNALYRNGQPTDTLEQRKAALLGFVYIAVDMQTFLDTVMRDSQNQHVAIQIRDDATNALAYQSANFERVIVQEGTQKNTSPLTVHGHDWRITLATSPEILSVRERQLPNQALWRGLLTCIFFAGLVWYLITDRERKYARQKQEEVQTAKDDLLSLASHQLRTPATVVKQYVGMLLQGYGGKMTGQQKNMLTNAYESNERQLEIINQLLYVARLDAGRINLRPQRINMTKLLQDVTRDQSESIEQRRHKLIYKLPKRAVMAETDPHYMRMVLENLLSNAVKYTPDGGSITLGIQRETDEVVITVTDTGVGISADVQTNIFDKFTRIENELSNDVNGSGVGLYLTQQIVSLHGGSIKVSSAPERGSTFTVRVPAAPPPAPKM